MSIYQAGQVIKIDGKGGFRIENAPGCSDCDNIKNKVTDEPCATCVKICKEMGRSNIKLVKVVDNGNLDEYLKYQ